MTTPAGDRNLLAALLALKLDFASLRTLFKAYRDNRNAPAIGEGYLVQAGVLGKEKNRGLMLLLEKLLQDHQGDFAKSLQELDPTGALRAFFTSPVGSEQEKNFLVEHPTESSIPLDEQPTVTFHPSAKNMGDSRHRYQVLRPHASGGLGQVSIACDQEFNREVAFKEIRPNYANDPVSRQRFLIEAEVTGKLEHPSIVPVYSLGLFEDGRPYYAMRLIRGKSLREAIENLHHPGRVMPGSEEWRRGLRALIVNMVDVCHAIEYAHSRGILHRDLKPANIMLGKYGETMVVDWGIAKHLDKTVDIQSTEGPVQPASGDGSSVTEVGSVLGTPAYMSPEQAEGRLNDLGPVTDVYSLGATLYCVLTGEPPFPKGGKREEILERVCKGSFTPPRGISRFAPKPLEAICLKAMALNPTDRYPNPRAMGEDLERWLADDPVSALPDPWLDWGLRHIRRHKTAFASILVLIGLGLTGLLFANATMARKNAELDAARALADGNFSTARKAILDLVEVAENELSKYPGLDEPRIKLMSDSVIKFENFREQKPDDLNVGLELAQITRMAGNVHRLLGENDKAIDFLTKAIKSLSKLEILHPTDTKVKARLTETKGDLGATLKIKGDLAAARVILTEVVALSNDQVSRNQGGLGYLRTNARLKLDLGEIEFRLGNFRESLELIRQASKDLEFMVTQNPVHELDPVLLALARSLEGSTLMEIKSNQNAKEVLSQGISEAVLWGNSTRGRDIRFLQFSMSRKLAQLYADAKEPEKKVDELMEKAIRGLEKDGGGSSQTVLYKNELARALVTRGNILLERRKYKEAEEDFRNARNIISPAPQNKDPDFALLDLLTESWIGSGKAARETKSQDPDFCFQQANKANEAILTKSRNNGGALRRKEELKELSRR